MENKHKLKNIIVLLSFCFCLCSAGAAFGQVVTAGQVNGTWREASSKPAGVTTEFRILSLGNQKLKVEFSGNNAAGKFSNTVVDTASIEGTTATFRPADGQVNSESPCVITLKFSSSKLTVTEKGDCGWGRGIDSAGTYKRISTKKPQFDEK